MKRVAVLRGGPSEEYEVSLKSGQAVLSALNSKGYSPKDIVITKKGEWLDNGFVRSPEQIFTGVDVVFIALHGHYGEDGQVQRIMQRLNLPFTGSGAFASSVAFNKALTKETLVKHKISLPKHRTFKAVEMSDLDEQIAQIFLDIGETLIVKPVTGGSSINTHVASDEDSLRSILSDLSQKYEQLLIEECIIGREATVGVLDGFRGEETYVLPVVEIVPPSSEQVWSHESKYNGTTKEIVPGGFSYNEKILLSDAASLVHEILDCQQYSRSDFIIRDGVPYFLEVNTLPGLTDESLFPKAAAAVGLEFPELITYLVETARV